jgi:hypothetical protein
MGEELEVEREPPKTFALDGVPTGIHSSVERMRNMIERVG